MEASSRPGVGAEPAGLGFVAHRVALPQIGEAAIELGALECARVAQALYLGDESFACLASTRGEHVSVRRDFWTSD